MITTRSAIITVSKAVLSGGAIRTSAALDQWRHAAAGLPRSRKEKLFVEIVGNSPFEPEIHVIGDPRNARTGPYYIRHFVRPVIEGFFGGGPGC
jgi:monoamine oxidase